MLRLKRNNFKAVSFAKVAARLIVAVSLALSFFTTLLPLRAAADAGAMGSMACCAGKAGHCHSGLSAKLLVKRAAPIPKPEPMCGLKPRADDKATTTANADEGTGNDKSAAETPSDGITILAAASETTEPSIDQGTADPPGAEQASQQKTIVSIQRASITKPCPADCRAGTTGVVRQPRPREVAVPANGSRGILPGQANWKLHPLNTNLAASATLKRTRPRGPPCFS